MALTLVRKLVYQIPTAIPTPIYESYTIYYDDAQTQGTPSDYFKVYYSTNPNTEGNLITTGPDELIGFATPTGGIGQIQGFVTVVGNIQISDDGTIYGFQNIGGTNGTKPFPYIERIILGYEVEEDINDLTVSISDTTPPSSDFLSDGEVVVTAIGTNQPFYIRKGTEAEQIMDYISAGSSGTSIYNKTISNLGVGTYIFTVRDSKNFTRTVEITFERQPAVYSEKYFFTFQDYKGANYKVSIFKSNYSGSATDLQQSGETPVTLKMNAEGQSVETKNLFYSELEVQLVSNTFREWQEFIDASEEDYQVRFYKEESSVYVEKWRGFHLPEGMQETLYSPPYIFSLIFTDRLKDLSAIKYLDGSVAPDQARSVIQVIHDCLITTGLNLGYRIACNFFESNHTTTDTTPFHQTYINTNTYETYTKEEVLMFIAKTFQLIIYQWEGYWYIERIREKVYNTTTNYVEYNAGLIFQNTGSYSNQISFDGATATNRWRWEGSQSQSYTPIYGQVDVILDLDKKEEKIVEEGFFQNKGWSVNNSNTTIGKPLTSVLFREDELIITTGQKGYGVYAKKSGTIESSDLDRIKFAYDYKIRNQFLSANTDDNEDVENFNFKGSYMVLAWALKVGDKWLDFAGRWNDTIVINQQFIDPNSTSGKIEIEAELFGLKKDRNYSLRIYGVDFHYADVIGQYTNDFNQIQAIGEAFDTLRAISTVNLPFNSRRILRLDKTNSSVLAYYELRESTSSNNNINEVLPDDWNATTNPKKWIAVNIYEENNSTITAAVTRVEGYEFTILPNGQEPPKEISNVELANRRNRKLLESSLYHFDFPRNISSSKFIYQNGLYRKENEELIPTATWIDPDSFNQQARPIKDHFMRWMRELYSYTRVYFSGQFHSDVFVNPKNIAKSSSLDDNRLFLLSGITFDYKKRSYSGEMEELRRDNSIPVGDFDNQDFNNQDFNT